MIGSLFLVSGPPSDTQVGNTVALGIGQGAANGQLTLNDQANVFAAAAATPGGSALNAKQLIACASISAVAGLVVGYLVASRSTKKYKKRAHLSESLLGWGESRSGRN